MAHFHGLEFCHASNGPDADDLYVRALEVPMHLREDLFFDVGSTNGNIGVPWYAVDENYYNTFRRSLVNNNRPPKRIYIQNQCTPDHGFEYQLLYTCDDFFVYQTCNSYRRRRFNIVIRMTQMICLQLDKAQFPVQSFNPDTWDAPEIPMSVRLSYISGNHACTVWPDLADTGAIVEWYVLGELGKNRAWSVKLVNGRNEVLQADQAVGAWAFGHCGYFFAVPKRMMSDERAAVDAFKFNPVFLNYSR